MHYFNTPRPAWLTNFCVWKNGLPALLQGVPQHWTPENYRSFINRNWTPEYFLSAWFHKVCYGYRVIRTIDTWARTRPSLPSYLGAPSWSSRPSQLRLYHLSDFIKGLGLSQISGCPVSWATLYNDCPLLPSFSIQASPLQWLSQSLWQSQSLPSFKSLV